MIQEHLVGDIDINEIFDNEIELLNKRRRKLLNEILN